MSEKNNMNLIQNMIHQAREEISNEPNFDTNSYIKRAQNGDKRAKDLVVMKYMNLVVKIANKYNSIGYYTKDDLISYSLISLMYAIDKYDENRKASFITFATICIKTRLRLLSINIKKQASCVNPQKTLRNDKNDSYTQVMIEEELPDEKQEIKFSKIENEFDCEILLKILNKIIATDIHLKPINVKFFKLYYGLEDGTYYSQQKIANMYNLSKQNVNTKISRVMKTIKENISLLECFNTYER